MDQYADRLAEKFDHQVIATGIFLIALAIRVGYWQRVGIYTPPATDIFLGVCENTSLSFWLQNPRQIFKIGYLVPQCFALDVLGLSLEGWIFVQIVVSAVTCVVVYVTAVRMVNTVAGVVSGLLLAFSYDTFHWVNSPLTETLFVFTVSLAVFLLSRFYLDPSRDRRKVAWLGLGFVLFTRPHGLGMVAAWVGYDYVTNYRAAKPSLVPESRVGRAVYHGIAAVGIVGVVGLFVRASFVGGSYEPWVKGWVLDHGVQNFPFPQIEYAPRPADNPVTFALFNADTLLVLTVLKIVAFFYPFVSFSWWGRRWQLFHNLTLWPLLGGGVAGIVYAIRTRNDRLIHIWLLPLAGLVALVALTYLDRTWRYRAPAGPLFALFTGYFVGTPGGLGDRIKRVLGKLGAD